MRRRWLVLAGTLLALLGGALWLWRSRPERAAPRSGAAVERVGAPRVDVSTLSPGAGVLAGLVRDADGRPLPGATLVLSARRQPGPSLRSRLPARLATSDAGGAFVFEALDPGRYGVTAGAPGYLPRTEEHGVGAGERREIAMALERGGVAVSGRVLDVAGAPLAAAQVSRIPSGFPGDELALVTALSDEQGRYRLSLPSGDHTLVFRRDGYAERAVEVRADHDQELDVHLGLGVRLSGRVVTPAEEPAPGATVTVRLVRTLIDVAQAVTDAQGRFSLAGLAAGSYEVVARRENLGGSLERPLLLRPPGEQEVVVRLDQGARVSGQVVHPSGQPVAEARLLLGRSDFQTGRGNPAGHADSAGNFVVEGVLPEHSSIIAFGQGEAWGSDSLHLQPGERRAGVRLVVPDVRPVVVQVTTAAGAPGNGVQVSLSQRRGAMRWSVDRTTGPDGAARFSGIPMGPITASARSPQASDGEAEIELQVSDAPVTAARLVLTPGERITIEGGVTWTDGRPGSLVPVYVYCRSLGWHQGRSDASGAFRVEGCAPGPLDVQAFRSQVPIDDWQRTYRPDGQPPLQVGERSRRLALVLASGGKRVAGEVRGSDGQPVNGALVTVTGRFERRRDSTTADGAFAFADLTRQPHGVVVNAVGHPELRVHTGAGDAPGLQLTLARGAILAGSVRGPTGKPRAYTRVLAQSDQAAAETYSAASGAFLLDGLVPGTYQLHLRGDDGLDVEVAQAVLPPEGRSDVQLVLPAPAR